MAGRGKRQDDARLFSAQTRGVLKRAVDELGWLLERGYTLHASLKLVGDRHALVARQREALSRAACTVTQVAQRRAGRRVGVTGERLLIDGFNVLITIEAALAGGVLVRGLDGATRDMASVHGSYRRVEHTHTALRALGETLRAAEPSSVDWYFDRPVSNSGRAAGWARALGESAGGPAAPWQHWDAHCVDNPDQTLIDSGACVASSDAWILDASEASFDLVGETLKRLDTAGSIDLASNLVRLDDARTALVAPEKK